MTHGENAIRRAWFGAAAAVLLLATGCGSTGGDKPDKPKASATQSEEQKERAAARSGALAAYRGMWDAQVQAYADGSTKNAKLGDYTTGTAAQKVLDSFTYYQQNGLTFTGRPKLEPKVTAVDVESAVHTATIGDCVDTTHYVLVKRATGKPASVGKDDHRHTWTAEATTTKDGSQWRITDYTIDKDRTC